MTSPRGAGMSADVEGLAAELLAVRSKVSGMGLLYAADDGTMPLWSADDEDYQAVLAALTPWLRDLLAQARREGQRDGWDEGYEAFAAQFTKPMDEAGQRPRATNPYRDNQTGASQ